MGDILIIHILQIPGDDGSAQALKRLVACGLAGFVSHLEQVVIRLSVKRFCEALRLPCRRIEVKLQLAFDWLEGIKLAGGIHVDAVFQNR